jgi:hypothetical protein
VPLEQPALARRWPLLELAGDAERAELDLVALDDPAWT